MGPSETGFVFIGIDIGTSSVKALMCAPGGMLLDSFSSAHHTERPAPGAAEQNPDHWTAGAEAALSRFAEHGRAREVAAIGVTSQVNTHVFCDAGGMPLHPALTWQDTRPAPQASRLDGAMSAAAKTAALGAPVPIDASHALARMAWVMETHPEIWESTAHVMLPKDFVIKKLTGELVTDPISSVGLVGADLGYAGAVVDLVPGAAARLPAIGDPLDIAGQVRPDRPFAGAPVAVCAMDAWAGMFGLGVVSEGGAMYLSGTSEVLGLISGKRCGAPGIVTFPDWRGITLHAGPTQSGGASLEWLSSVTGQDFAAIERLAGTVRIGRGSPLFLPHLEGERAPLWDPHSRGAFAGMTSVTGPAELAGAVMEGVALSARLALESIETSGGRPVRQLRHGGGGASSDAWCRIRANALGRTLSRAAARETGAMGALVMAGAASGGMADLREAAAALVTTETVFRPEPDQSGLAEDRFGMFQELYSSLYPLNRRLMKSCSETGQAGAVKENPDDAHGSAS